MSWDNCFNWQNRHKYQSLSPAPHKRQHCQPCCDTITDSLPSAESRLKGAVNRRGLKLVVFVADWSQHRGQVPPRQVPGSYTGRHQSSIQVQPRHKHQGSTQVLHRQAAGFYLTSLYYLTHHSWTSLAASGVKEPWFANKVSWRCVFVCCLC